jgi:hypothetical protein
VTVLPEERIAANVADGGDCSDFHPLESRQPALSFVTWAFPFGELTAAADDALRPFANGTIGQEARSTASCAQRVQVRPLGVNACWCWWRRRDLWIVCGKSDRPYPVSRNARQRHPSVCLSTRCPSRGRRCGLGSNITDVTWRCGGVGRRRSLTSVLACVSHQRADTCFTVRRHDQRGV